MSITNVFSPPTRLGPECDGMRMTPEEFDAIEEWDEFYRYELVRGVLIVMPIAGPGERSPNDELGHMLRTYYESHPSGPALDDTLPEQEIQTVDSRRRTDRAIWCGLGRAPDLLNDVPAIAVEFVSESSRDRHRDYVEKREEYGEAGVKEYWVIDRFRREMTVFAGENETVVGEGETYATDLLPGFELELRRLLAKADKYESSDSTNA